MKCGMIFLPCGLHSAHDYHLTSLDKSFLLRFTIYLCFQEHFRLGCNLVNFLFVADEHLDALGKEKAHKLSDEVLDALHNPMVV